MTGIEKMVRFLAAVAVLTFAGGCTDSKSNTGPDDGAEEADEVTEDDGRGGAVATDRLVAIRTAANPMADGEDRLISLDLVDGSEEELLAAEYIESLDLSSNGRWLAFYGQVGADEGIFRLDLHQEASRPEMIHEGTEFYCPRWVPGVDRLLVVSDDGVIEVLDAETGAMDYLTHTGGPTVSCADPVDQERAVYRVTIDDSRSRLFIWSDGADLVEVGSVPDGCGVSNPAVSPSGDAVVVDAICEDGSQNGLWIMSLEHDREPERIVGNDSDADPVDPLQYWAPAWTPDGERIVYHVADSNQSTVRSIQTDGTGEVDVLDDAQTPVIVPGVSGRAI